MLYNFCAQIRDQESGLVIIPDFECQVEVSVEVENGLPDYSIDAVFSGGADLLQSEDPFIKRLGHYIVDEAETDTGLQDRVNEREGLAFRGNGFNDPDGRFVRASP